MMPEYVAGILRKRGRKAQPIMNYAVFRDVVAFCPGCKTIETIGLIGQGIAPTRRFSQRADSVYHACGSEIPCRLYSLS